MHQVDKFPPPGTTVTVVRKRVFCAPLADVFDFEAPEGARERLWQLIRDTPNLDWLLLTKRPKSIRKYLPKDWNDGYPNVWLGVTCENRKHGFPRVDVLRNIPAVIRFISCEPLLENISDIDLTGINWVILGGESGPGARPFDIIWARGLREACQAAGTRFFTKQLGSKPAEEGSPFKILKTPEGKRDRDGKHVTNIPGDLRVREVPAVRQGNVAPANEDPAGLPIAAFKQVVKWLDDYATNDAGVLTHFAQSAIASLNGMVAVLTDVMQERAA